MGRGFLGGAIWGTVVAALLAGTASVIVGVDKDSAPNATALEVPAGSEFNQSRDDGAAVLPTAQTTPIGGDAPRVEAPLPDTLAVADIGDTETASQPVTGQSETVLTAPSTGSDATVSVQGDAPVLPNPQSTAPQVPEADSELSISTDPAQPSAPSVPDEETAAFPQDEVAAVDVPATVPDPDATPVPEPVSEPEPTPDPVPETVVVPDPVPSPLAPVTPQDPVQSAEQGDAELAPRIGKQAGSLKNLAPGVSTNRLPSLQANAEADTPDAEEIVLDKSTLPPLERYAEPFENKDEKPVMAIVLMDDGTSKVGVEALASFPYPISFAIDPTQAGAEDAMAMYRARGFEVLALTDLPEGASASDVEVTLAAGLPMLPEAVGIMEKGEGSLQGSREISDQVTAVTKAKGMGLVLFPKGLNTAQKLAVKDGVAAATVFRDFDGKGQNEGAIRRFLDQAAFRAGQEEGGVIMVGRLKPETVSALILWGLQDRASRLAFAPVSAVLRAQQN